MVTVARDVTERVKAEEEINKQRRRLHNLTRGLLAAQERERSRIAMELHDQVGQELTAIKLLINAARTDAPAAARELGFAAQLLDGILENVRTLSFELRPSTLDELGLAAALRGYVTRHAGPSGLHLRLSLGDLPDGVPPDVETACFRIAQEAVTNVLRHAHAKRLGVRLRGGARGIELVVEDDGVGLASGAGGDPELTGLGIAGMSERAAHAGGRITFAQRPRGGTRLRAFFPLSPAAASSQA
jgi:signal transduction histidine kinase